VTGRDQTVWLLGGSIPWGQWEFRASWVAAEGGGATQGKDADQFAVGFIYNLSKRTALYGTYSTISNDGAAAYVTAGGGRPQAAGKDASGYELGLRHSF
jgi:predicted porin